MDHLGIVFPHSPLEPNLWLSSDRHPRGFPESNNLHLIGTGWRLESRLLLLLPQTIPIGAHRQIIIKIVDSVHVAIRTSLIYGLVVAGNTDPRCLAKLIWPKITGSLSLYTK